MSVAAIRHFLDLIDIPPRELSGIIEASRAMKKRVRGRAARPLDGRTLAMIFDKPSNAYTRLVRRGEGSKQCLIT